MKYSTWLKIIDVKSAGWKMLEYWSKTATLKWAISSAYQHLWCLVSSLGDHSQIITTFAIPPAITSYCSHSNYSHHHPSVTSLALCRCFYFARHILYRDLKPENLILDSKGEKPKGGSRAGGRQLYKQRLQKIVNCHDLFFLILDVTTFYPGGWKHILFGR